MTINTGTQTTAKLKKNLVLWHIIIIGLAYIQPLTLFDTFGLVSDGSQGHVPTSYIFALVAILLTSISYGHMISATRLLVQLILMRKNRSTPMSALWLVGRLG